MTSGCVHQIVAAIKNQQEERALPDTELVQCIWQGLISSIEWSARQDQNENLALKEITVGSLLTIICASANSDCLAL